MSILIRGMEMPKRCMDCNFGDALMGKGFCYVSHCKQIEDYFGRNDRPSWCPFVEIPPHGRLIDENVIRQYAKDVVLVNGAKHRCIDATVLCEMPCVIESEGEDD